MPCLGAHLNNRSPSTLPLLSPTENMEVKVSRENSDSFLLKEKFVINNRDLGTQQPWDYLQGSPRLTPTKTAFPKPRLFPMYSTIPSTTLDSLYPGLTDLQRTLSPTFIGRLLSSVSCNRHFSKLLVFTYWRNIHRESFRDASSDDVIIKFLRDIRIL